MSQDYDDYGDEGQPRPDEDRMEGGDGGPAARRAMERTNVPGIFLIILGVLNFLGSCYFVFNGIVAMTPAGHAIALQQIKDDPEKQKQIEQLGWDMEKFVNTIGLTEVIVCGIGILAAIMSIAAGAMMRNLKGYTLAVLSSILLCIPCVSPAGCCLLGEVFGIWSLIVLLSPDVKSAFR